jgi:TolB-like protein
VLLATSIAVVVLLYRGAPGQMSARTAAGHIQSLAVLPFDNLTGDPSQDYFVDGMTDALTTDLAAIGGFDVIARTSAMRYKDAKEPLAVIGRQLNVDALLAGAIVRSERHLRITAQLSHAATERVIWAQSYEGELSDAVDVQRKIARAVAAAVGGRLGSPTAVRGGPPLVNPEAYDAYLKASPPQGGRATTDSAPPLHITRRPSPNSQTSPGPMRQWVRRSCSFCTEARCRRGR